MDLRTAEMCRDAPRLSVPEHEYVAVIRESCLENGKWYRLVDRRELQTATSVESDLPAGSLGTFRLETGGLACFVVQSFAYRTP